MKNLSRYFFDWTKWNLLGNDITICHIVYKNIILSMPDNFYLTILDIKGAVNEEFE